jgi:cobalamin biosynthesis Co2+ chelatase CbiK
MLPDNIQKWLDVNPANRFIEDARLYTMMKHNGRIFERQILMGFDSVNRGFLNGRQSEEIADMRRRINEAQQVLDSLHDQGYEEVFYELKHVFINDNWEYVPRL